MRAPFEHPDWTKFPISTIADQFGIILVGTVQALLSFGRENRSSVATRLVQGFGGVVRADCEGEAKIKCWDSGGAFLALSWWTRSWLGGGEIRASRVWFVEVDDPWASGRLAAALSVDSLLTSLGWTGARRGLPESPRAWRSLVLINTRRCVRWGRMQWQFARPSFRDRRRPSSSRSEVSQCTAERGRPRRSVPRIRKPLAGKTLCKPLRSRPACIPFVRDSWVPELQSLCTRNPSKCLPYPPQESQLGQAAKRREEIDS